VAVFVLEVAKSWLRLEKFLGRGAAAGNRTPSNAGDEGTQAISNPLSFEAFIFEFLVKFK
jgi:hypothetical protein